MRVADSNRDIVTRKKRSQMMAAVGQRNTPPELAVRRILSSLGIRYRVSNRDLPGSPDVANRSRRWAVFVNGCFWHGHKNCPKTKSGPTEFRVPRSNGAFWRSKLEANRSRDATAIRELRARGFSVTLVWECELRQPRAVAEKLQHAIPVAVRTRKEVGACV
jgi:DNA mismatch endonuclease, patch repair protein